MFWWAEDAWQRDTSLHHGPCLIPKVTFGVGWGRQELRAWLAVSMGGIKQDLCPVSPPAVCPSHRCIMGWHKEGPACCSSSCEPKRHTQHQTCLWLWDEEASHLLGKGRACCSALGTAGDGAGLCSEQECAMAARAMRGCRTSSAGLAALWKGFCLGNAPLYLWILLYLWSQEDSTSIFCPMPSLGQQTDPCVVLPVQNSVFPFLLMPAELIETQESVF